MIGRREIFSQPKTLALNYGMLTAYLKEKKNNRVFFITKWWRYRVVLCTASGRFYAQPNRACQVFISPRRDGVFFHKFCFEPVEQFSPSFSPITTSEETGASSLISAHVQATILAGKDWRRAARQSLPAAQNWILPLTWLLLNRGTTRKQKKFSPFRETLNYLKPQSEQLAECKVFQVSRSREQTTLRGRHRLIIEWVKSRPKRDGGFWWWDVRDDEWLY